jgi:hypothetical protein
VQGITGLAVDYDRDHSLGGGAYGNEAPSHQETSRAGDADSQAAHMEHLSHQGDAGRVPWVTLKRPTRKLPSNGRSKNAASRSLRNSMNSRLRWRSLTSAWTFPVTRSIPASRLTVPWRLYSCSRAKVAWTPGLGGKWAVGYLMVPKIDAVTRGSVPRTAFACFAMLASCDREVRTNLLTAA